MWTKEGGAAHFELQVTNEPFGSRPEPGAYLIAPVLLLPPGEVPEGRARGDQVSATPD